MKRTHVGFVGFIDDRLAGKTVEGYPIIGNFDMLEKMDPDPYVSLRHRRSGNTEIS